MATLQTTVSGDFGASMSDWMMAEIQDARGLAYTERERAKDKAKMYGVDPMLRRGEFFAQALAYKMTPNPMGILGQHRHKKPFGDRFNYPDYLARGQSTPFASPINPKPTNSATMAKLARQPFPNVAVGSPLKYQQNSSISANTPIAKKPFVNTNQTTQGVVVRDEKLGNFMAAVAWSLSASLIGMNSSLDDIDEKTITFKDGLDSTLKRLELGGNALEDKLDALIEVLRGQTDLTQQQIQDRKVAEEAADIREAKQNYEGEVIQRVSETQEEFERRDARDEEEDVQRGIPDPWDDMENDPNVPKLKRGGLVDGDSGGFPAWLHPGEMVIPWNNNAFKDGEERVSPRTSIVQNFTMNSETPTFDQFPEGFLKSAITPEIPETPEFDDTIESVGKAIELPAKAAGIITFKMLSDSLKGMKGYAGDVEGPIKSILTPLTSAFGIEGGITNNLIRSISTQKKTEERKDKTVPEMFRGKKERAWWDFLGWAGTGEGGGDNIINRSTSNVKGSTSIMRPHGGGFINNISSFASNAIEGVKNWWGRGRNVRFNEDTASWRRLIGDDWSQRGKFGKGGKLGGWDFTRGFRPGVSAAEGGMGSGPTPLIRQTVKRTIDGIRSIGSIRGGLAGLILNDLMNPQPLADGTLEGNREMIELLRSQGYDVKTNTFINAPSSRGSDSNFVNLTSYDNQTHKIDNYKAQQDRVQVINNTRATKNSEQEFKFIANNPDRDLGVFYPDPYLRGN